MRTTELKRKFTLNLFALCLAMGSGAVAHAADYFVVVPVAGKKTSLSSITVGLNEYALPAGVVSAPYAPFDFNALLNVTGDPSFDPGSVSWSVSSGSTPAGLVLSSNGVLSGTPSEVGTSTFTVQATYKTKVGVQTYTVKVNLPIALQLQSSTGTALTSVNYGSVPVGVSSDLVAIRLVNKSAMSLTLSVPAFSLDGPFSVVSHDCGATLAVNAYCTLQTRFSPVEQVSYSKNLRVTTSQGEGSAGPFTGVGGALEVVINSTTGATSFAADTYNNFNITFLNKTGASIQLNTPNTTYTGAFKYEPNGGVTIPANSTATLAGRVIAAKGTHSVPITFKAYTGSAWVPATVANLSFNVSSAYANTAAEVFTSSQELPAQLSRRNYTGWNSYSYFSGLTNPSGVAVGDLKALVVQVPAGAVSPNLIMYGYGRDGSTVTVHEGSVTGTQVNVKTFGAWTGATESWSVNLTPGKTYYVVPRNNGSSVASFFYASLRWN